MKQVKCLLGGKRVQYVWIDTRADSEGASQELHPCNNLSHLYGGISSCFPLANHCDLPSSQSIFGISQDPSIGSHASLNQDGYYRKGKWVRNIPWHNSHLASKELFLYRYGQGGLLTSRIRNTWSGQGPTSSFHCLAIFVLEFRSVENESLIALGSGGPARLTPTSSRLNKSP